MYKQITLNIRYDIPDKDWVKILDVYKSMDGWLEGNELPCWYDTEDDARYILASAEPSGILLYGELESDLWTGWLTVLCSKLTLVLGRPVHDAEM